ncbi:MAG: RsmE family RNA methyltransferase [Chitinophagaceae bacterium]
MAKSTLPVFYSASHTDKVSFDEANSRHIVQVLRMSVGERVLVTDGKGKLLTVELTQANKKGAEAKVISVFDHPSPPVKTCIAISLVKNTSRFEWFLEKSAELGISEIVPLLCERTEKQHFRLDRMRNILVSAMLQSQQSWLTLLYEPMSFSSCIESFSYKQKYIAHCQDGSETISISAITPSNDTIILIGPEGDFTNEEISRAFEAGYIETKLGDNRLRTETAGIVAASFLKIR